MHARYYTPHVGRFVNVDPIDSGEPTAPQSWNRYSFALGNPLKFVDPDGEDVFLAVRNAQGFPAIGHSFVVFEPVGRNQESIEVGDDGRRSLAAFPDNLAGQFALVKGEDNGKDLASVRESRATFTKIETPLGMTDEGFEPALEEAFSNFENSSLNYNNSDFNLSGRNSNAFASGLLSAAGVSDNVIDSIETGKRFTPGLRDPIPRRFFEREDNENQ